jgi:hypothetical protein
MMEEGGFDNPAPGSETSASPLLEQAKQQIEYAKHIAALSTGSIVLIGTLLEKVFHDPVWRPLIGVSVFCFLASVAAAVIFQGISVVSPDYFTNKELSRGTRKALTGCLVLMWVAFLGGLGAFSLFAVLNLVRAQPGG